jgi:16S rRNA processing protein RimM
MTPNRKSGKSERLTGSPNTGEPEYLAVGKLRKPHGLRGEVLMEVLTDFPERLKPGAEIFMGKDLQPLHIRSTRWHKQLLLVLFDEFHDPESAAGCRNQMVYVPTVDRPALPEGEYYQHELLGLQVINQDGDNLGRIEKILDTGANDVLIVRSPQDTEILLPVIESVIGEIDLQKGKMRVTLLPGLLP